MAGSDELRRMAVQYRRIALTITDQHAIEALYELADEYEARADAMDAKEEECASRGSDFKGTDR